jgi:hypothetical protein
MIGYDSAFIGTTLALPSFISEFRFAEMDPDDLALIKSNIVSIYQVRTSSVVSIRRRAMLMLSSWPRLEPSSDLSSPIRPHTSSVASTALPSSPSSSSWVPA